MMIAALFLFSFCIMTSCNDPHSDVLEETLESGGGDGTDPIDDNAPPAINDPS